MAKSFPAADFKKAVKLLNTILKDDGEKPIKVVGVKKEEIVENFTNKVLSFIDEERVEELPDEVIDFYNSYIVTEASEEDSEEKPEKTTKTKSKGKGKAKTKPTKTPKEKKAKTPRTGTKKEVCIEFLRKKGGGTLEEMAEEIVKRGIDDDLEKNKRTCGLWMRKIGFKVKKQENGKWIADE